MIRKRLMPLIAFAALTCGLGTPASATTWDVNATFSDGGTLTGYFTFNVYGYVGDFNLQTSANSPFAGFDFTPGGGNIAGSVDGGKTTVTFFGPNYDSDQLTLVAANSLTTGLSGNYLTGASFECVGSFSCPTTGTVRTLDVAASTISAVPEPATWAMLVLGFGVLGYGMRRKTARQQRLAYS